MGRFRWIPSSSDAALANLMELPGEQFGQLVETLVPFQAMACRDGRERRFPLPGRLMAEAHKAKRAARELERAMGQGLPAEPVIDGLPLVEGQPNVGDLVAQACEDLRASAAALVVASQASRDQALLSEVFQPEAVPWWVDLGAALTDRLAEVLGGLRWVKGTDLVQIAIWTGIEKPAPLDADLARDEIERRRSAWAKALDRARKLRDTD